MPGAYEPAENHGADDMSGRAALVPGVRGDIAPLEEWQHTLRARFPVAIVAMPFQSVQMPSIHVGLLRAISESHGFCTEALHLSLDLAGRVGHSLYEKLAGTSRYLIGDWLFSKEAFQASAPDRDAGFLHDFAAEVATQLGSPAPAKSPVTSVRDRLTLLRLRDEVIPAYLNAMMTEIDWSRFRAVFFSMSSQQTAASLALARRIKDAYPEIRIVFGGWNFDDEMGMELMHRALGIDHAILGECEAALPELLVALAEGKSPLDVPGVASRADNQVVCGGERPLFRDLDALPIPKYDDYFERAEATGFLSPSPTRYVPIPFENTRVRCRHQRRNCRVCGPERESMRLRAKSVARIESELSELAHLYGSLTFRAVDERADADFLQTLFLRIVAAGKDYQFFYDVKPPLTREHLKAMHAAGVSVLTPGIVSFSSLALRRMKQGATVAQNVNTLRWATYYGVWVRWSIPWGFPDDTAEAYTQQAKLVRQLVHLNPPQSAGGRVRMERFGSLYKDEEAFMVDSQQPDAKYSYVYPASWDLDRIACFFENKSRAPLDESIYAPLSSSLQNWIDTWRAAGALPQPHVQGHEDRMEGRSPGTRVKPSLTSSHSDDFLQIVDFRRSERIVSTFEGPLARLYKAASEYPVEAAEAAQTARVAVSVASVERALNEFCERGLMMRDDDTFLSLALPATRGR